jgi:ankyrin repeat protein/signal recognition particle receptor subunit beta
MRDVDSFLKQIIEKETSIEEMFFLACKVGHLGVVKYMTTVLSPDFIFDPSLKNRDQHTALSIACQNRNVAIVAYLIGLLSTYIPDTEEKIQVFLLASEHGELPLIKKIVEDLRWNPDVQSADRQTPLYVASLHGHISIVRYLLRLPNFKPPNDVYFAKTLFEICKQDHLDILKETIEMGKCDPLAIRDRRQRTLLHIACQHNLIDMVQYLIIDQGFDLNVRDEDNRTPLHSACLLGHLNIVEYLTSRKECILNARNSSKRTPMHSAAIRGHVDIVQYLVAKRKCSPSVADKDQRTPLHFACQYGRINVVRYLCKIGCLSSIEDGNEMTPLHYASQSGHIVVIEYLIIAKKCSPSVTNKDHCTPLHFACYNHRYDAVKCLLRISDKTDINAKDKDDQVPFEMIRCRKAVHKLLHFLFEISRLMDNEIVRLLRKLIARGKWDPTQRTSNEETALHFASRTGRTKVTQYLLDETCCNMIINTKNTRGESPLLLAKNRDIIVNLIKHGASLHDAHRKLTCELADSEAVQTMKYLIRNRLWDPNQKCDSGNGLHFACRANREQIVSYLLSEAKCNPNDENNDGQIPLQLTSNPEIVFDLIRNATDGQLVYRKLFQELQEDVSLQIIVRLSKPNLSWNPCQPLDNGDTALHHACRNGRAKIVNLLLSEFNCDPNVRNCDGATPLDLTSNPMIIGHLTRYGADLENVYTKLTNKMTEEIGLEVVRYLSREDRHTLNKRTRRGDNVLHFVCRANQSRLVHYLLCETNCDINAENTAGEFPLQSTTIDMAVVITNAAEHRALQIVTHTIVRKQDFHCNGMTLQGASILHLACQFNKSSIVCFLLAEAHLNPCTVNHDGETPIQLASDPEIVRGLIQYGANPPNVYKTHGKILGAKRQPPQPSVKVFVIGNHAVGKSTLISAIKTELSFMTRTFSSKKKVMNVDEKTVGVVPHEFNSKRCGQVALYDLAGQREFYSGHSCLLKNASHSTFTSIFLIVINLCDCDQKIKQNLLFWLSFIKDPCASSHDKPHVIVVGSHADIFKAANRNMAKLDRFISSIIKKSSSRNMIEYCGIVPLDCRYFKSAGMTDLCSYLKRSCDAIRPQDTISFNAYCFQLYLFDKFREFAAIQMKEIRAQLMTSQTATDFKRWEIDPKIIKYIPTSVSSLNNICSELSNRNNILYFKDETNIENSWIILDKMALLSTINGTIFAPDNLKEYYQLATSTGVVPLSKLTNHFPNQNPKMLVGFLSLLEFCYEISDHRVIELIEKYHLVPEEKYLFFPALIRSKIPDKIWEANPRFTHVFGWSLQCTQSEDFFKCRLIQVLLLRLAFHFALVPSRGEVDDNFPAFQRKSSVWKSGIFWGNRYGVETLVEVLPCNKEIVVLVRGQENNLVECLQLQSQVLTTIRETVAELCTTIETEESILDPSVLSKYPIRSVNKFSMAEIAKTLLVPCGYPCVVSPTGTHPISSLLPIEPYAILGEFIFSALCDRAKEAKRITDSFISSIAQHVCKQELTPIFIKMFSGDFSRQPLSNVLYRWRESTQGTYRLLREKIDQYSMMTALDIMVSVASCINARVSGECSTEWQGIETSKINQIAHQIGGRLLMHALGSSIIRVLNPSST